MIKDVRSYMVQHKQAPMEEIAYNLHLDKAMVQHVLSLLVKKGELKKERFPLPCNTCNCGSTCFEKDTVLYKYVR